MLEKCEVKSLDQNVFTLIGEQWTLITAGTPEHCNTMTASWGGLGVLWGADVATCYIRPQPEPPPRGRACGRAGCHPAQ